MLKLQVLAKRLNEGDEKAKIVSVDLQPMAPIDGVTCLQGDITSTTTAESIISHFDGNKADLIVCDGAPDVTGLHDLVKGDRFSIHFENYLN